MSARLSRRRLLAGAASTLPAAALGACVVRTASRTETPRELTAAVPGASSEDGAGVKLRRLLGTRALPMLDPFLMLDEIRSGRPEDFMRGFPDHPHRGFETVSIVIDGHVVHRDSAGDHGDIGPGGVQWMTAGRGIIHSEMPRPSETTGGIWGYQLWVNLPARLKMRSPRYQDLTASAFPDVQIDDARVRVIAGAAGTARGPVEDVAVAPTVLDVRLEKGARLRHPLPAGDNVFLYTAEGALEAGARKQTIEAGSVAVLGSGDVVDVTARGAGARFLLFAASPIKEPVARRGPFVMNTDEEIRRAFEDYRSGRLAGG